ncbi:hypothetical protein [Lysinibacillus sp. JNUCC 51]|uniref:hypothetical protein n=1 Tax=Lysinibacillus sp. JNUCC-51 TaxID=2792479 RepID=UPI001936A6EF|nr:hypothetical protein JNUCC51_00700 [Lysinibacillus sp. JNUCC-51]
MSGIISLDLLLWQIEKLWADDDPEHIFYNDVISEVSMLKPPAVAKMANILGLEKDILIKGQLLSVLRKRVWRG